MSNEAVRILEAGFAQVTDLGRAHGPRYGLSLNGALDQGAAKLALAFLGRYEATPLFEILSMDFAMQALTDTSIVVTGAQCDIVVDGIRREHSAPLAVESGQIVRVVNIRGGLRVYVAIDGLLDVPRLLGSCAPDDNIGFGVRCTAGDVLRASDVSEPRIVPELGVSLSRPVDRPHRPRSGAPAVIDILPGPELDDFGVTAERLTATPYVVRPQSNHVGLRMAGLAPRRGSTAELRSRGVPVGAIEVAAEDELLVLLRGRGVTAGYAVAAIATVTSQDKLGQVKPGDDVRFRFVTAEKAVDDLRRRDASVARIRARARSARQSCGIVQQYDTTENHS